jgi:hydrogenase maturation factor
MDQHQISILIAAIVAVAVITVISFVLARKRRSHQLRERFGPEYDRVVKKEGEVRRAEGVLEMREVRDPSSVGSQPCRLRRALADGAIAVCR